MTMNGTWGFSKFDGKWKSAETLLQNLIDIASKGGNYLLNVGPTADGEIPAASIERLQTIGTWMKTNAEAVHGTQASPFPATPAWGRCTSRTLANGKSRLYLHVFDWPADGLLVVKGLKQKAGTAALLADPSRNLEVKPHAEGLQIQVPAAAPDAIATVIALDLE
jgi:alpha-L-fucosidase